MAEAPGQKSKRKTDAQKLDKSNQARVALQKSLELHSEDWPKDTIHLHRYQKTPPGAPAWAVNAWLNAIDQTSRDGANDTVLRKLNHAKVDDLHMLLENIGQAYVRKQDRKKVRPVAAGVAEEWERLYPEWVAKVVSEIRTEHAAKTRHDPSSVRSLLASLTEPQRRTADAYRKTECRPSRGSGKRKRGPSKKALAVKAWVAADTTDAAIVRGLLVEKQGIAGLGQRFGMSNGVVKERFRIGLESLHAAISATAPLKGPHQFPQEIVGEKASIATSHSLKGPQQFPQKIVEGSRSIPKPTLIQ